MEPAVKRFIKNVDNWIKVIRKDQTKFQNLPAMVKDLKEESQFQYELIMELSGKIEELDEDVRALKLIQLIKMKK